MSTIFSKTRRINVAMLMKVIGWLLMIEGAFMTVPFAVAFIYGEDDWIAFGISTLGTIIAGAAMTWLIHPESNSMGKREGFLLTTLVWIVFSLFGMVPFILSDNPLPPVYAFFETMSGFTTTGITTYVDVDSLSHAVNMWRCLTQWLGGMGIILFTIAVLPMLNSSGGMQMFNAEVTGITHEKLRPRISQTAKSLWLIYFCLSAAATLLLWAGPMDFFDSVCHGMTTISTGGFSSRSDSFGAWGSNYIMVILTIFMFLGGVDFALIFQAWHGNFSRLRVNNTFKTYVGIIIGAYVLLVIAIFLNGQATSLRAVTIEPIFQIVNVITSTGLTVNSMTSWGSFAIILLCIILFFGGCAGSTSGGAKIDRLIFLFRNSRNELYRSLNPNAVLSVRFNGAMVAPEIVEKVIAFLCMYVMIIIGGCLALSALGMNAPEALFHSFSCVCNGGIVTGSGGGIYAAGDTGLLVMCMLMLTGRLELFTVLVLFTPRFWLK